MLKDVECKKGQLAQRLPIPYVPVVDLVTPKEDPAVLKVKLLLNLCTIFVVDVKVV